MKYILSSVEDVESIELPPRLFEQVAGCDVFGKAALVLGAILVVVALLKLRMWQNPRVWLMLVLASLTPVVLGRIAQQRDRLRGLEELHHGNLAVTPEVIQNLEDEARFGLKVGASATALAFPVTVAGLLLSLRKRKPQP